MFGLKIKWPALEGDHRYLFIALLLNAFCAGNIWILMDITSHSFLLSYYSNTQLFLGFILAGLFISLSFLFLFVINFEPTPYQKLLFMGGLNLLGSVIYLFYYFSPNLALLYVFFCLSAAITVFTLYFYSSFIENIIPSTIRNSIFPIVDLTKHVSTIFSSFMALLILYMDIHIKFIALFLVVSASAYMISLSIIAKHIEIKPPPARQSLRIKWGNIMPLFTVSAFVAFIGALVHIQFVRLSIDAYPNIWGIAKVLTLFYGTLYLFNYLTKKVIIPRVLTTYDSPFSLVISPSLLILNGIVFVTYFFLARRFPNIDVYIFPLLGILVLKIILETTKNTIDIPALKVATFTFLKSPHQWQQVVIGVCTGIATTVAGILYIFKFGYNNTPLLFSILLIVFALGWMFFTIKMARLIQLVLKSKTVNKHKKAEETFNYDQYMINNFSSFNNDFMSFFKRIYPNKFPVFIEKLLHAENDEYKKFALMNIDSLHHQKALQILEKENVIHNPLIDMVTNRLDKLQKDISFAAEAEKIETLSQSFMARDRCKAAHLISLSSNEKYLTHLIHLLRDIEPEVKIQAIKTARYYENSEIYYLLVDYLNSDEFYSYAFDTLVSKGNAIIDYIEQLMQNEVFTDDSLFRIIKLFEKIASFRSVEKIIRFIDYPSQQINMRAVKSLENMGYTADDALKTKLFNLIVRQSNIITWNLSIIALLYQTKMFLWLRKAFEKELQVNYNDLFLLLHLLYPKNTIEEARQLLAQNTYSSVSYASELLDSVLQEDLKKVVLPIISYGSYAEKLQQLHFYYTLEENTDDLHKAILNRDINLLSPVTKAIAIYTLGEIKDIEHLEDEIIATLFHADKIVRESAIYIMMSHFYYLLKRVYNRLNPDVQEEIELIGIPNFNKNDLLLFTFDKFANHNFLNGLSSSILLQLAEKSYALSFDKENDNDLFELVDFKIGFIFVEYGNFSLYLNGEKKGSFEENDLVFIEITNQNEGDIFILRTKKATKIYCIEKNEFEKMCFDHDDLYNCLFQYYINRQHQLN
ncbi:MAG: hypothetical protein GVY19_08045 [Bacteroidetes bacterium]|nr:hypothetical protein [Bacteroidota bacterium]